MQDVAILFGEIERVHFVRVEEGSVELIQKVEFEAVPKVEERLTNARAGEGPSEAIRAISDINRKLRQDNGVGILARKGGATIIKFPGRDSAAPSFGFISQEGSLDGIVNMVGGDSDPCPVHLKSSDSALTHLCDASRAIAKELARTMFDLEIRAHGVGRWFRDDEGEWKLERFRIRGFDPLKAVPLTTVVAELRSVPGSGWRAFKDPLSELDRIRRGPRSNGHK